ncbi:unnamed protein product [Sphagnum tenellum]
MFSLKVFLSRMVSNRLQVQLNNQIVARPTPRSFQDHAVHLNPLLANPADCHLETMHERVNELPHSSGHLLGFATVNTTTKWWKPAQCSDILCLVESLLAKNPNIIIDHDIDVSGSLPLPTVTSKTTILGICLYQPCILDAKGMGQIFVVGVSGYLTIKNLELTGGYCSEGSAVLVSGAGPNTEGITGGKLLALNILFSNNTATGAGGAVMVKAGASMYLQNSIFQQNKAVFGGAIFIGSTEDFPTEGCGIVGSSCGTVSNTAFWWNEADLGGAVYIEDASVNCAENGGHKFECTTCSFQDNSAKNYGGAILLAWRSSGAIGHIKETNFVNNTAGLSGADIETQPGLDSAHGVELNVYECMFSGSPSQGGKAVAVKAFANATFTKCVFSTNNSVGCGGRSCSFCPQPGSFPQVSVALCPTAPLQLCDWVPPECANPSPSHSPPPASPLSNMSIPPPSSPSPTMSPPPVSPLSNTSIPPPSPSPTMSPPPLSYLSPPIITPTPPSRKSRPPFGIWKRRRSPPMAPPPGGAIESAPPAPPPPPGETTPLPGNKHLHHRGRIIGDPHFFGKHGERFDFHGRSNRDYCVLTDKDLQINMHLFRGVRKGSTFISMIGMLFKEDAILINAQSNANATQFSHTWTVHINDVELQDTQHQMTTSSGVSVIRYPTSVEVAVIGFVRINMNIVRATSRSHGSRANYINFEMTEVKVSPSVHGVLGQTYQETNRTYQKLHEAHGKKPIRATVTLVDGVETDYITSGILASDCKFSSFEGMKPNTTRVQRVLMEKRHNPFSGTADEELVSVCTGFGDRDTLCINHIQLEDLD